MDTASSAKGGRGVEEGISKWRGIRDFQPGDVVLCRVTRPLVAVAFSLIRRRIACRVLGRDIGKGIADLARKAKAGTVGGVLAWLDDYQQREGQRLRDRQRYAQAGLLEDRCETLRVFCGEVSGETPAAELIAEIERLFTDDGGAGMLTLSTIHKFKGMERNRVFILDASETMPSKWARQGWELQQERNCMYIAATRAKRELRYVTTFDLSR